MEPHTPVKEFLQWLVSKGELNFFLADSTARALTRAGCKTVSDLQSLDDAKWASLRLALDTTQKVRKHLDQRAQVKIVEVASDSIVIKDERNETLEAAVSLEEIKKMEQNKRARRISMELRNLNTDQQREMRRKNFSRIEKRRIVEESKRKQVLEDKRRKLQEEQRSQEEKYKQLEAQKVERAKEMEDRRKALVSTKLKEDRERLAKSPSANQLRVMQDRTRVEVQLEEEKRELSEQATEVIQSIPPESLEARLSVCWLEWLSNCEIPTPKVKEYAVAFTLNNLLPSRVVELKPNHFIELGVDNNEHKEIIVARCNSSIAVLRMEFDFETD